MPYYSQNDEELYILQHTAETGHFLDIGAYDGKTFSNTHALANKGWSGVCVEPSPIPFTKLNTLYHNNQRIILVNAMIGFNWGLRTFYDSPEAVATTEIANYELWKNTASFTKIYTPETPIYELLHRLPGPYHFISIDTEGTSFNILQTLPLNRLETTLICVEYDTHRDAITKYLTDRNYNIIHTTSENLIAKLQS